MKWLSVRIYTAPRGIEPLCGRLYLLGAGGVQIEDAEDFNEFVETCTPHWDYIDESLEYLLSVPTSVTAYVTDDEAVSAILEKLIAKGHTVYVVTDTPYQIVKPKMEKVIFRYYPFLSWKNMILTSNKKLIGGDIQIGRA